MLKIRQQKMVIVLKKDSKPEEPCVYLFAALIKASSMVQNPGTLPELRNLRRALKENLVAVIYKRKCWRGEKCTQFWISAGSPLSIQQSTEQPEDMGEKH